MDNLGRKRANVEEVKSLNLYLICLWWFDNRLERAPPWVRTPTFSMDAGA
jgi:hypothetical protein